jgi:cytoskeletal protein RodZ
MTNEDIGGRLRRAREHRGLSLGDVARVTKLSTNVLRAIEHNDFASLPAGMYRKAYLRSVAAEVGLNPHDIAAEYHALYEPAADPERVADVAAAIPDRWIEELTPSRRRAMLTLTVLAALSAVWFGFQADPGPAESRRDGVEPPSESPVTSSSMNAQTTVGAPALPSGGAHVSSPDISLKIDLTTTGWCWVAAESDGERVLYELVEPGQRLVVEGQDRISLRVGDAGAVQLSINGGPRRVPGADGEVVEMVITSDAAPRLDDAIGTESELVAPTR